MTEDKDKEDLIDDEIDNGYPAHMVFHGKQAGGTSWNGVGVDVLKSGIQKYIRRGNFEKALWCMNELDLFNEMYFKEKMYHNEKSTKVKALKALTTNLMNRLIIISVEDVGIGRPTLPLLMKDYYGGYMHLRSDPVGYHGRRRIIYNLAYELTRSRKSREASHIKAVYSQAIHDENMWQKYRHLYPYENEDRFTTEYDQGSDKCFYWFLKYPDISKLDHVISRENEDTNMHKVMEVLYSWYKRHKFKENILFAIQIILLGLRRPDMSEEFPHNTYIRDLTLGPRYSDVDDYYDGYLKNLREGPIEIDDFIIDKHTKKGKKSRGMNDFVYEGSYVENEDPMTTQLYKDIYTELKGSPGAESRSTSSKTNGSDTSTKSQKASTPEMCSAIIKSGKRKGERCGNRGKNLVYVDGVKYHYCGTHRPGSRSAHDEGSSSGPDRRSAYDERSDAEVPSEVSSKDDSQADIDGEMLQDLLSRRTPRAQRLTGSGKMQVLIPTEGRYHGYIIKGPWKEDRLQRLMYRSKVLTSLGARHIEPQVLMGSDGRKYTIYRNIATTDPSQWRYEEIYDRYLGMNIYVVDRVSMGIYRLNRLSDKEHEDILFGEKFMFRTLLIANMLKVGDLGPNNILISDGEPYLIDYEENTTHGEFSKDRIYSKSAKKYTRIFTSGLKRINIQETLQEIRDSLVSESLISEWDKISSAF